MVEVTKDVWEYDVVLEVTKDAVSGTATVDQEDDKEASKSNLVSSPSKKKKLNDLAFGAHVNISRVHLFNERRIPQ